MKINLKRRPLVYRLRGSAMRCYFLRDGHIVAVEVLAVASDDEAIAAAKALFDERYRTSFQGFEVWDRTRFVHRYPSNDNGKRNGSTRGA